MKLLFIHLLRLVIPQSPPDTALPTQAYHFPDSPTTRILTLYVQLPIARWPGLRRNPFTGSSGLVFIDLYASDGKDSARQLLAFRPQSRRTLLLSSRPVAATLSDESYQYYHAYLRLPLTAQQWIDILKNLTRWARFIPYRSISCNSTTFACALLRELNPRLPGIYPPDYHHPSDLYRWMQTLQVDVSHDQLNLGRKKQYAGASYTARQLPAFPTVKTKVHE